LIFNFRKNTPEENGVGDVETPEAQIPEVNIDHLIWRDAWHLIYNFRASTWSLNLMQI
jgi:hypothetical protein